MGGTDRDLIPAIGLVLQHTGRRSDDIPTTIASHLSKTAKGRQPQLQRFEKAEASPLLLIALESPRAYKETRTDGSGD